MENENIIQLYDEIIETHSKISENEKFSQFLQENPENAKISILLNFIESQNKLSNVMLKMNYAAIALSGLVALMTLTSLIDFYFKNENIYRGIAIVVVTIAIFTYTIIIYNQFKKFNEIKSAL